jgi:hypothetical protein
MAILAAAQTVIVRQPVTDSTPAILTIIGAILVAVIAAGTAQWRLRTQLAAERTRLEKQLEAEGQTHRNQLSFERGETDRRELRSILDNLTQHLYALQDATSDVVALAASVAERWDDRPDADSWRKRSEPIFQRMSNEGDQVSRQQQRVRLRLGESGVQLAELAHRARIEAIDVRLQLTGSSPPWTAEKFEAVDKGRIQLNERFARFQIEALRFTRAELHEPVPLAPVDGDPAPLNKD